MAANFAKLAVAVQHGAHERRMRRVIDVTVMRNRALSERFLTPSCSVSIESAILTEILHLNERVEAFDHPTAWTRDFAILPDVGSFDLQFIRGHLRWVAFDKVTTSSACQRDS